MPWRASAAISAEAALAALEVRYGGRLGVACLDTGSGRRIAMRAAERFPLLSTFKLLAAACVLARVDRGVDRLDRHVTYVPSDLVPNSPVTQARVADGLSLGEICKAAITRSDNTAGNLMLDTIGGPAGLTAFLRANGDAITRLDRREPDLNEAAAGDVRDTTTPDSMLALLQRFTLDSALTPASRTQLADWLTASTTGGARLRAGLPRDWRAGDKTGTGENGSANDVAILWPPDRAPLLVVALYIGANATPDQRNGVLAEVGRIAVTL